MGYAKPDPPSDEHHLFTALVTHPELTTACSKLFKDGHYARAVEEAMKAVNNRVKERTGLTVDGRPLMEKAFSIGEPRLRLNPLGTQSERDEQLGYMAILSGCMHGIRNPRAHEHRLVDTPRTALQLVVLADHLFDMIDRADVVGFEGALA